MENMKIENAKYCKGLGDLEDTNISVTCKIDGQVWNVPMDENNTHYVEILKQVADGDLTIADAD